MHLIHVDGLPKLHKIQIQFKLIIHKDKDDQGNIGDPM